MKKIKLIIALLAAVAGSSAAIASNVDFSSSPQMTHTWVNWDNEIVLMNQTQEQAQLWCAGNFGICLRAQDNLSLFTTGELLQ